MEKIKQLTKKEKFTVIREYLLENEIEFNKFNVIEFIDNEISLLEKKATSGKKQQDYTELLNTIIATMVELGEPTTIDNLRKVNPVLSEYSNQKINSMMIKLKDINKVVNTKDKKKSYYSLIDETLL